MSDRTASGLTRRTVTRASIDRQRRLDAEVARHLAEVREEWEADHERERQLALRRCGVVLPPLGRRRRWQPGRHRWWPGW